MKNPDFSYEKALWRRGFRLVAGVDEAGTGALAGPVTAGAVILPDNSRIGLIRDSKLLSPVQRKGVLALLERRGAVVATGLVTVEEVNSMNIRQAALLAMRRAVDALAAAPDALIVDAFRLPGLRLEQLSVVHGDRICKSVAAASIAAKVRRDALLVELDSAWPGYGFAGHKGYATAEHLDALRRLGPSPVHRRAFAPVRQKLPLDR